eukprot:3450584-Rhodomonas_salina.2
MIPRYSVERSGPRSASWPKATFAPVRPSPRQTAPMLYEAPRSGVSSKLEPEVLRWTLHADSQLAPVLVLTGVDPVAGNDRSQDTQASFQGKQLPSDQQLLSVVLRFTCFSSDALRGPGMWKNVEADKVFSEVQNCCALQNVHRRTRDCGWET